MVLEFPSSQGRFQTPEGNRESCADKGSGRSPLGPGRGLISWCPQPPQQGRALPLERRPSATAKPRWPMAPPRRVPGSPTAPSCSDRSRLSSGPARQICNGALAAPVSPLRVAEVCVTASFHRTCGRTGSQACAGHEEGPAAHPPSARSSL